MQLRSCARDELHVVRAADGVTTIQRLTDAFADPTEIDPQAIARAGAAALLARRVIVAEGRTEVGFFRAMARAWRYKRGVPVAHLGTTVMDGEEVNKPLGARSAFLHSGTRQPCSLTRTKHLIRHRRPLPPPAQQLFSGMKECQSRSALRVMCPCSN